MLPNSTFSKIRDVTQKLNNMVPLINLQIQSKNLKRKTNGESNSESDNITKKNFKSKHSEEHKQEYEPTLNHDDLFGPTLVDREEEGMRNHILIER
jgi:hypothetical protein